MSYEANISLFKRHPLVASAHNGRVYVPLGNQIVSMTVQQAKSMSSALDRAIRMAEKQTEK